MKNILFYLVLCLTFSSCFKDLSDNEERIKALVENCETFKDFSVPITDNNVTVVVLGEDTVAVVTTPITIKIPKTASVFTRSNGNDLKITYVTPEDMMYDYLSNNTYSSVWQAIMFEDSKNGDYDYNDLIIHVRSLVHYKWQNYTTCEQTINIQPIALGSGKVIGLGCVLSDNSEHIISYDVREDFFEGRLGFINTVNSSSPIRYKLMETKISYYELSYKEKEACWVAWFIIVDGGKRQYAISGDYDNQNNLVDKKFQPYGLTIANNNGTFKYPYERMNIGETYSNFKSWIDGKSNDIGVADEKKCYVSSYRPNINGVYIWDWQDLVDKNN